MDITYRVFYIQDICRAKSVLPRKEILSAISDKNETVCIDFELVWYRQTDTDFMCIASLLQENLEFIKSLIIQDLDFNKINASHIAKIFKVSSYIQTLSINFCSLGPADSFDGVWDSISRNRGLTSIDLSYNNLCDDFSDGIRKVIESPSNLKELVLDFNEFSEIDLGSSLIKSSIESFSINYNPLDSKAITSILASKSKNNRIKYLSLKGMSLESGVSIDTNHQQVVEMYKKIESDVIDRAFLTFNKKINENYEILDRKILNLSEQVEAHEKSVDPYSNTFDKNILSSQEIFIKDLRDKINANDKEMKDINYMYHEKFNEIYQVLTRHNEIIDKWKISNKPAENWSEIDLKISKNHYYIKSRLKNINDSFCKKNELDEVISQISRVNNGLKDALGEIDAIKDDNQRIYKEIDQFKMDYLNFTKFISDYNDFVKDTRFSIGILHEKVDNALKLKSFIKQRDEDVYQKISDIQYQYLENKKYFNNTDTENEIIKINLKLGQIEQITAKTTEYSKTLQNLIETSFKKINSLEENISNQPKTQQNPILDTSFTSNDGKIIYTPIHLPKPANNPNNNKIYHPENLNYSKNLTNRIEKLEKLNIHKRICEAQNTISEQNMFFPGETESLVRSAVLEKVTNLNKSFNLKPNLFPSSPQSLNSFEEDIQPSEELRKSLIMRGLAINNIKK